MREFLSARELAAQIGLRKTARDWRGDCPACGYRACFSVRSGANGRALAWCASCQDRDAIAVVLRRITGGGWTPPQVPAGSPDNRSQAWALRLWSEARDVSGTLAERYLARRQVAHLRASPALRFSDQTRHLSGPLLPTLIAIVVAGDGRPLAVHRTWLDRDTAWKTSLEPARASLGSIRGGAIRLTPLIPDRPLVVGEGIETSASAGLMMKAPAWAAISAGNLAKWMPLPDEVRDVVIAADPGEPGERAAREAAERWCRNGRRVRIARPHGGSDFNAMMMEAANA